MNQIRYARFRFTTVIAGFVTASQGPRRSRSGVQLLRVREALRRQYRRKGSNRISKIVPVSCCYPAQRSALGARTCICSGDRSVVPACALLHRGLPTHMKMAGYGWTVKRHCCRFAWISGCSSVRGVRAHFQFTSLLSAMDYTRDGLHRPRPLCRHSWLGCFIFSHTMALMASNDHEEPS